MPTLTGGKIMKYGVRNSMKAVVTKVKQGDVMSQVECKLKEANVITSVLTTDSLHEMDLREGDQILLLVKAIHVIPAKE
jgi:molybdate transport system regulatory protein